ncbi:Purine-cytosine permease fcyB [Cytospora mali]|uniref:Purine-cytosine permease fcyB n=1 Tax=Cytospora mali TaxID=578113 RepID=A0A194W1E2_CYTMA|nr:Purine-cytosine permease fcyB [Valsa mali]
MTYFLQDTERRSSLGEKDHVVEAEVAVDPTTIENQAFQNGNTVFGRVQQFAGKFGVEQRGIERVPPGERTDTSLSKIGTLWMSANMTVSSFAIGALAQPIFKLGFVDTALTIVFVNILGILPVSFFSTFGPRFGLRQMVLSRFFFGYYGVKLIAIFNILACLGWSSVNVIVGAQLLASINPSHPLPGWAGILIIALSTLLITTFGYRIVHAYERWSWVPVFVIFCIVAGEFGHSGKFNALLPLSRGPSEAGCILSFAASVYGFATGWTTYAADFTVYQPEARSRKAIFWWTFGGLFIPLVFTELLGAAIMTASAANPPGDNNNNNNNNNNQYLTAYHDAGIGGLLAQVLAPPLGGFGGFCLIVLALSIIANNCPNIYSVALSLQVLARRTQRVPRFAWSLVGTAAYVAVSVPGYAMFESWLENFMLLIGYWLAIYEGVALAEHFVFRRGRRGYVVEDYDVPSRLPPGMAALGAFMMGVLGAVLGMAQVWFTGPVGRLCGGDVGFELGFGFSALAYLVLRAVERGRFGR